MALSFVFRSTWLTKFPPLLLVFSKYSFMVSSDVFSFSPVTIMQEQMGTCSRRSLFPSRPFPSLCTLSKSDLKSGKRTDNTKYYGKFEYFADDN